MRNKLILSFLFLALIGYSYCDLPVHCLHEQVIGQWKLQISEPQLVEDPFRMNCGHETPDNPANSYLALHNQFTPSKDFLVTLNENADVLWDNKTGTWTMIYDEGFDILFDNHRFTTFFEYFPDKKGEVISYCGRTVVGWYTDLLLGKKACFKAVKQLAKGENDTALYGKASNQVMVVQPDSVLLQVGLSPRETKGLRPFLETSMLHGDFKDHKYIVDKINNIPNKLWEAAVHPRFEGKTLAELNALAGRKKYGSFVERGSSRRTVTQVDTSDLPKEFSWKEYLKKPREQGSCGSCYIFSTLQMLEIRLKIKYGKDVTLSPQHVLDCSFYNQGCDGGYPFLVEKHASDFGLVPESCSPYLGKKGSCQTCDMSKLDEVFTVEDYKFIGGAYGKSDERNMMVELMEKGPILVSIEPTQEFMYYKKGIFHSLEPNWVKEGEKRPIWEKVDHSVLVYGWGESDGEKYWLVLNSWGEDWGENGSVRIRRGVDEIAIESMGEAADPVIISKKK